MSKEEGTKRALNHPVTEDEGEEGKKNKKREYEQVPVLLNPDILDVVFKHLDFFRLKLCRTVCKGWNKEICRGLRDRSVTYIPDIPSYLKMVSSVRDKGLPRLIQSLSIFVGRIEMLDQVLDLTLPITKLGVSEELDCHHSSTTRKLQKLLAKCSLTLTSLKIPVCSITRDPAASSEPSGSVISGEEEDLKFPLLEELTLAMFQRNLVEDHGEEQRRRLYKCDPAWTEKMSGALSFLSKLTSSSSAPKLSRLVILDYSGPIDLIIGALSLSKITELKIWAAMKLNIACRGLRTVQFENLKSLSLHSRNSGVIPFAEMNPILEANSETLESLSLDVLPLNLCFFPALKTLTIRNFDSSSRDLSPFPSLNTVRINKIQFPFKSSFLPCPAAIKRVEIRYGQELLPRTGKESLRNLYQFLGHRASEWELPYAYVEDFCDFLTSQGDLGSRVKSLTIGFVTHCRLETSSWLTVLTNGLLSIRKLPQLEELRLKNSQLWFVTPVWNSLDRWLDPKLFSKLRAFSCFCNVGFAKLEVLISNLRLVREPVLLRNGVAGPVCYDAKDEEVFSRVPHATVRYEEAPVAERHENDSDDDSYAIQSDEDKISDAAEPPVFNFYYADNYDGYGLMTSSEEDGDSSN